mmetsp:Transcript_11716/g.23461  ORF Transcript_11716/g.23461 Transcript_11716/m.23461 type:complete len:364 (+) Transcript_11716:3-1094(+)
MADTQPAAGSQAEAAPATTEEEAGQFGGSHTFGGGHDFGGAAAEDPAPTNQGGGSSFFSSMWKATQKVANDVGAGGVFSGIERQVTKIRAQQYGDSLVLVENIPEVDEAMVHIKETHLKYTQLHTHLQEMAAESAKSATPLRKTGAAFIRCATISDKVAREMATSGKEGFFKETPTYQQDLNEALLVTSGAMLYQADRLQNLYTTTTTIDASRAHFEQGNYSTKYYVKQEKFGPGPIADCLTVLQELLTTEVAAGEKARRQYRDCRLEISVKSREHDEAVAKGKGASDAEHQAKLQEELKTLASYREDLLSAFRILTQAKKRVWDVIVKLLQEEKAMHEAAIKSLTNTLAALPNAPAPPVMGT